MKDKYLSKEKFVKILRQFDIPMNEGISADKILESGMYPKLTFWAYCKAFSNSRIDSLYFLSLRRASAICP